MDYSYPPGAEAFRHEFRAWLDVNVDDRRRALSGSIGADDDTIAALKRWNSDIADAGFAAIAWPRAYGGRDASVMDQVVWAEEMDRSGAPGLLNPIGLANIAPAIMEWGTAEQKDTLLPRMRRGDDIWCQGFSEPDAGSDLASLRTTAVADGDDLVVNGQKIWNTLGQHADWCELLVRTDPEAPKHKGISCLLVDMGSSGIEVRPITTIAGDEEFNEIFFTDVRVPASALLGPVNEGWRVAMTTLNNERAGVATLHLMVRRKVNELIAEHAGSRDPVVREHLARAYLDAEYLRYLSDRALSAVVSGRPGAEGSLVKLVWSETSQRLAELTAELAGADGLAGEAGWGDVRARSLTIAGGTTQVNKNIVAQRVLGLPRT